MKKFNLIFSTMLLALFIMAGCGQDSAKQKELDLKAKELALKEKQLKEKDSLLNLTTTQTPTQTPTQTQTPANTQPKSKEEAWTIFWSAFSNAVNQKNQKELQRLAQPDDKEFNSNEGVGAAGNEYSYRKLENWDWENMQNSVKKGIKQLNSTKKSTKDEYCVFVYRNNNWYFYGIISD